MKKFKYTMQSSLGNFTVVATEKEAQIMVDYFGDKILKKETIKTQ